MTVIVSRLYDSYDNAIAAVRALSAAGIRDTDVSVISNRTDEDGDPIIDRDRDGVDDTTEATTTGAGIGATLGGAAGLLAGLGLMAIPGLGPVVAAGWLASTAAGAVAGGAAGGIIGALTEAGVSDEDAHVYAEGVRRGGTLVTARVPDGDKTRIEALLNREAVNTTSLRNRYTQGGWSRFDSAATPYSRDQLLREREAMQRERY